MTCDGRILHHRHSYVLYMSLLNRQYLKGPDSSKFNLRIQFSINGGRITHRPVVKSTKHAMRGKHSTPCQRKRQSARGMGR